MMTNLFAELVRQHFSDLLVNRGYRMAEEIYAPGPMGSAMSRLVSAQTELKALSESGSVYFQLGPKQSARRASFDLEIIMAALHPELPALAEPDIQHPLDLDMQLQQGAQLIFQYCEPLLAGDWSQLPAIQATQRAVIAHIQRQFGTPP